MKDILLSKVKEFLLAHIKSESPVLIGLSGGVDSSFLFSLLLEFRSFTALNLHVVHYDHAWREESLEEACLLRDFVESFSIPFYSERAQEVEFQNSNLEEKARNERFAFFQKVYKKVGAQALVLAHQKDDQVETVLKRFFEGAGVLSLGGMQASSIYETMSIWRPLLSVAREEIESRSGMQGWIPFKDRTNLDLKFLRPRMRQELIPVMESCFGKKIRNSLFRVGEELSLLKGYLERRLQPYVDQSEILLLGSVLPLMSLKIEDSFERQEVVRLFLRRHQATLSSDVLKKTLKLLEGNLSNKQVDISRGALLIERGDLIWLNSLPRVFQGQAPLNGVPLREGASIWEVQIGSNSIRSKKDTLRSCFLEGKISYRIEGISDPWFSSYALLIDKDQKKISGYLAKNKIPAKMKEMFPFVINNGRLIDCDFCFNFDLKCEGSSLFSNIILKL